MSDLRPTLQSKFAIEHRYANFGPVLMQMHVKGFRCHTNTLIEFGSPIVAFCGLNGTGKSTLVQLAAASCKRPAPEWPSYYIKDFLVVGKLDPSPFSDNATVEYKFWEENHSFKTLKISRRAPTKRWSDYRRRPERAVLFAGVSSYIPWIEQRNAVARHAGDLTVETTEDVEAQIRTWTCTVLDRLYDNMQRNTVSYAGQRRAVVSVVRGANRYSEAHMGYGEARSQFLIEKIESLPSKSLVLIEEPEISLHAHAQHQFGRYLVDVSVRKGHQILLTTHSDALLGALPSESRVYLHSGAEGIGVVCGLTALEAKSLMTRGHEKALHILVEDEVASSILRELLRKVDDTFLSTTALYVAGGSSELTGAIRTIRGTGLPVAVVLDGDKPAVPHSNIFKLPGNEAPEKELFANHAVRELISSTYAVNLQDFTAGLASVNHHEWCSRLAQRVNQSETALVCEMARAYVTGISETEATSLSDQLKEASRR
jgi:predicted ATPase